MKKTNFSIAFSLLAFSTISFAGNMGPISSDSFDTGLFIGLGGSYNSMKYDQKLNSSGVTNVYPDDPLDPSATGSASGVAAPFHNTQSTFAPEVQGGYVQHFKNTEQLWGIKFLYRYLGITSSYQNMNIPLVGSFTDSTGEITPFSGALNLNAAQINVEHEFALMPFIGHSFTNSYLYLGAGPSLFKTQTNYYGPTASTNIYGVQVAVANIPDYSSTKWMWGGAAEIGLAYYIDSSWFVDVNYSYAVTKQYRNNHASPFYNSTSGFTTSSGSFFFNASQQVTAQAVKVSINKVFSL